MNNPRPALRKGEESLRKAEHTLIKGASDLRRSLEEVNGDRQRAEQVIEHLIRKAVPGQKGVGRIQGVQLKHVHKVIKSRAMQDSIGQQRGAKVWGWLANAVKAGTVTLKMTTEWTNEWINDQEHMINALRADSVWAVTDTCRLQLQRHADREEAVGSIKTWMKLNEEEGKAGFQVLRAEKREALRTARNKLFKRLGGIEAMYAALAIMTAQGNVVMEQDRGGGGHRATNAEWITRSITWANEQGWLRDTEDPAVLARDAKVMQKQMRAEWEPREGRGDHKILDVGEGWGSIGIAVSKIPGCSTIGLDRAGFLEQGTMHGLITSRLRLDLCTEGRENVLRRAAKMASRQLEAFKLVWLSPECRILTEANAMNLTKGCTNGKWLEDPRNKMSAERLEEKREEMRQCETAVENQVTALVEETERVHFALENPRRSQLWDMIERNTEARRLMNDGKWRLVTVDQCAYGRLCKKPTRILTNMMNWEPTGMTGTGRCVPLKCGGTKGNRPGPGQNRHAQQMITKDPTRKPRVGEVTGTGGRREYSVKAGKNMVQEQLVQEIVRAALE